MARIINKPTFRNETAKDLFDKLSKDSWIYECGTDNYGRIYFAWLNGNVDRYTRREFIKKATKERVKK